MRSFIKNRLPGMIIVGMVLLAPAGLNAQSAGPVGPLLSKTKQEADRLVAMTQPGYYKTRLVPNWRAKQVNSAQAVTAVAELCNRSRSRTVVPPTIQLTGERLDEQQVKLSWAISEAVMTDEVGIERSFDAAVGYEAVGWLPTTGSAGALGQILDANAHRGYSYYRLSWTNAVGQPVSGPPIAIRGAEVRLSVKAFPNPGPATSLQFEVAGQSADAVSVVFYDVQGRTLYQNQRLALDEAGRFSLPASLALAAGQYYVRVLSQAQPVTTAFVVQP